MHEGHVFLVEPAEGFPVTRNQIYEGGSFCGGSNYVPHSFCDWFGCFLRLEDMTSKPHVQWVLGDKGKISGNQNMFLH
jgi:hypothetical protein